MFILHLRSFRLLTLIPITNIIGHLVRYNVSDTYADLMIQLLIFRLMGDVF